MIATVEIQPQLSADEIYAAFRSHFESTHQMEIFVAARRDFPNKKRVNYRQHAQIPSEHRLRAAEDSAAHVMRYFIDRQPGGYRSSYLNDTKDRKLCLPTANERRCIELVTDYLLAEDHVRGLALTEKPRIKEGEDEDYPPLGEGARRFLEYTTFFYLTRQQAQRVRRCEVCDSDFLDESRAGNSLVCGEICRERKDALRQRKKRNDGDGRLKRYRERQDYEYPFYNPRELFEISTRGESVNDGVDETITRARLKQTRGVRKPTEINMDYDRNYSPNGYKFRFWRADNEAADAAGPVRERRKRPEVIARYLRRYYGI